MLAISRGQALTDPHKIQQPRSLRGSTEKQVFFSTDAAICLLIPLLIQIAALTLFTRNVPLFPEYLRVFSNVLFLIYFSLNFVGIPQGQVLENPASLALNPPDSLCVWLVEQWGNRYCDLYHKNGINYYGFCADLWLNLILSSIKQIKTLLCYAHVFKSQKKD